MMRQFLYIKEAIELNLTIAKVTLRKMAQTSGMSNMGFTGIMHCKKDDWRSLENKQCSFVMSPYEQLFADVMFARGTAGFVSVYLNEATQGWRHVLLVAGIALLFSASKFSNREDVALDMSRRVKGNSQEWRAFVESEQKGVTSNYIEFNFYGGITDSNANMNGLTSVWTKSTASMSGLNSWAGKKTFKTTESSRKSVNFCSLTPLVGNGDDVVIPSESIQAISERFVNSAYGFFLEKRVAYHVVANCFSSEDGLDTMLEHEDVGSVLVWVKFPGVPMMAFSEDGLSINTTKLGTPLMLDSYTSDMCMQSWGRSSYARAMIDLQADEELKDSIVCPKKIISDVVKNLNNPRQATRCVLVGPNVSFKPTKRIYRPVFNKNGASTSGKKKQAKVSRQEVNNLNPFDALNSIENDDNLGTNGRNSKSAGKGSLNVAHGSSSNTPIIDKIDKLERQILDGKLMFVDDDGNHLFLRVEVTDVMVLIACWNNDEDYDMCDDNLHESHDMSELQSICDDFDITVRGRKRK
ncbi:hypothetical protein Tco_0775232 [Tanacetum coccineum]